MRYAWLALLILTGTAALGERTYAADSAASDEQTVAKLENDWNEAANKGDKATLERVLAEDFTSTDDAGNIVRSRSAYIDAVVKGPKAIEYKYSELVIKMYGNAAVVTGRWTGKMEGSSATGDSRFTDTFVKLSNGWKGVATQDTRISK